MHSPLGRDEFASLPGHLRPGHRTEPASVPPRAWPGGGAVRSLAAGSLWCDGCVRPGRPGSAIMPEMRSEQGHDQLAAVTGGSAVLGLAIAAVLAQAGSGVLLASRSADRCADAAADLLPGPAASCAAMPATSLTSTASPASSRGSRLTAAGSTCW